jgi:peptidoglycan/LPS O-acetylase OafA/YrhL
MSSKIHVLHFLRGLAALLVAFGHASWFPFDDGAQNQYLGLTLASLGPGDGKLLRSYNHLPSGTFGVACFFLLSGYVLEFSLKKNIVEFLVGRVFRIYPTYLLCFVIFLALMWSAGNNVGLITIIRNILLLDSMAVVNIAWTLAIEMRYYIYSAILAYLGFSGFRRAWIFLIIMYFTKDYTSFWLCYMSIGAIFSDLDMINNGNGASARLTRGWLMALLYAGAYWLVAFSGQGIMAGTGTNIPEIGGALFVFLLAVAKLRDLDDNRVLSFLGDISYPLYCVHIPCVAIVWKLGYGRVPSFAIPFVAITVAIAAAWLVHRYVEVPFVEYGRQANRALRERGWSLRPMRWRLAS